MVQKELRNTFEKYAKNYSLIVHQGTERIFIDTPAISTSFMQCNALLLINPQNGVTLVKHAGPLPVDVWAFDRGLGDNYQDKYDLFINHIQRTSKNVIAQPIYGDLSEKRKHLLDELCQKGEEKNINVQILDPLKINSGDYPWALHYDPKIAKIIIKRWDNTTDSPIFEEHSIPEIDPHSFSNNTMDTMEIDFVRIQLKKDIMKEVFLFMPDQLERSLQKGERMFGKKNIQELLYQDIYDGKTDDSVINKLEHTIHWLNPKLEEDVKSNGIRCVHVLQNFDKQNDETKIRYLEIFCDAINNKQSAQTRQIAINFARPLIESLSDEKNKVIYNYRLNRQEFDANCRNNSDYTSGNHEQPIKPACLG